MKRPIWVELGLFMLQTREQAVSYVIAAAAGAVLLFVGTIIVGTFVLDYPLLYALAAALLLGGFLGLAALWYWLSIRWMDTNGGW